MRLEGLGHNLATSCCCRASRCRLIGLVALPWTGAADRAVRPVLAISLITFLVTSLLFPVATTVGHVPPRRRTRPGPASSCRPSSRSMRRAGALGRRLGWTRTSAGSDATMGVAASVLFSAALLAGFGSGSRDTAATIRGARRHGWRPSGHPLGAPGMRLMSNFPIWVAETQRVSTLALPDEPPTDVLDLAAAFPGTRYLILTSPEGDALAGRPREPGRPGAECFAPHRPRAVHGRRRRSAGDDRPSTRSVAPEMHHDRPLYSETDGGRPAGTWRRSTPSGPGSGARSTTGRPRP